MVFQYLSMLFLCFKTAGIQNTIYLTEPDLIYPKSIGLLYLQHYFNLGVLDVNCIYSMLYIKSGVGG